MTLTAAVKQEAHALGFHAVGISRVDACADSGVPLPHRLQTRLLEWIRRGFHGVMAWMEREPVRRTDPRSVLPGCRSIISVGLNYYTGHRADERPGHGRIARYAWGMDYHKVLQKRLAQLEQRIRVLAPEAETRSYVDTGPVMEKAWAQQGGLGWIGKHSNLVSSTFGSWLLLGEVLTTLDLDPEEPGTDLCGACSLCMKACPTGAIVEPYVVDARRCISYLTIELPRTGQAIPTEFHHPIANRIFGCDDCLEACPYNVNAIETDVREFQPSPVALAPPLSELAALPEREFDRVFHTSPVRRAKYGGFLRTLGIALANQCGDTPTRMAEMHRHDLTN